MKCSKSTRLIPAYLDGELGEKVVRLLEKHLSECSNCRAEADAFRQTLVLLNEWSSVQPRLGIEALRERLKQRAGRVPQSILPVPRWAAATLAVMSIMVGAALGLRVEELPATRPLSEQQIASAVGLPQYDDLIEESLAHGIGQSFGVKEAVR
ncbi:MAG: zf-HC2 domain-containing protein [Armatimonadetes bacterium]|nr:zf-HC2 domain-containing protein [Armatimonadota bacterium]